MYSPTLLDRIRVNRKDGLFLVIRADHDEQAADLLPFKFGQTAIRGIPFKLLERWELESLLLNRWRC
jgi:hypothetical protein